jgi:hypothetical protein
VPEANAGDGREGAFAGAYLEISLEILFCFQRFKLKNHAA